MTGQSADVVVIGGGVRGTSVAYHLAKAGVDVTLLERAGLANGASGATFAEINVTKPPEYYAAFSLESARLYRGLEDELGEDLEFRPVGVMPSVIEKESEFESAQWAAARLNRVPGIKVDVLNAQQVHELEPALAPHVLGGVYCSQSGHINPFRLVTAYARAARRQGARILTYTAATGLRVENGRVAGVETGASVIATHKVVNAAGVHVPTIGSWVGLTIPVVSSRGQVVTTERLPKLIHRPTAAVRQVVDGTVFIGATEEFIGQDKSVTYAAITRNTARAVRIFPVLKHVSSVRLWAGLRPFPVDGIPIMGEAPTPKGFYICTGHSGISLAQVTGKVMTELVTTGQSYWPIENFSLRRFGGRGYASRGYEYYRDQYPLPD